MLRSLLSPSINHLSVNTSRWKEVLKSPFTHSRPVFPYPYSTTVPVGHNPFLHRNVCQPVHDELSKSCRETTPNVLGNYLFHIMWKRYSTYCGRVSPHIVEYLHHNMWRRQCIKTFRLIQPEPETKFSYVFIIVDFSTRKLFENLQYGIFRVYICSYKNNKYQ